MAEEKSILLGEMTWQEIKEATGPGTVVVLPVGSTEQHGPHMPLKTDHYFVYEIAKRAALKASETTRVLVAPVLAFGCSGVHIDFPGTISIGHQTYIALIEELGGSILKHGFEKLLILNGHGGNFGGLIVAARDLYDSTGATISVACYWHLAAKEIAALRESPPGGISHSGEMETSCMLFLDPSAVRWEKVRKSIPKWKSSYLMDDLLEGGQVVPALHVADFSPTGVVGDPTIATREKGEGFFKAIVNGVADFMVDFADWDPGQMRVVE